MLARIGILPAVFDFRMGREREQPKRFLSSFADILGEKPAAPRAKKDQIQAEVQLPNSILVSQGLWVATQVCPPPGGL
jgi:hypothetical protein